jgi:hypothetical protein
LPFDEVPDSVQAWAYTVLVTNAQYEFTAVGQLYRDRCDCEDGFDELKNRWGWGGLTTREMHRSQVGARAVDETSRYRSASGAGRQGKIVCQN